MYIILAILVFGFLIATHELGHFIVAKLCGIRVLEYSIGMGPAIWKKQGKETEYSLRILPIGGYCSMEGEDEESDDPRAFTSQAPWKRALILVAGTAMNFITGLILILILFSGSERFSTPVITDFMEGCPYEGETGFQVGDTIYEINGHRIYFTSNVTTYLDRDTDGIVDIVLLRDNEKVYLNAYPLRMQTYELNGERVQRYGFYFGVEESGIWNTLKYSWYCAIDFVRLVWMSLGDLISGSVGVKDLSGPVGIVSMMNDVGQNSETVADGLYSITYLAAFIAINLSVMNLLPLPALDGGRIFFLIITAVIEKISGREIDPKYEGYLHFGGFALLLALMIFVMYNDIMKIFVG